MAKLGTLPHDLNIPPDLETWLQRLTTYINAAPYIGSIVRDISLTTDLPITGLGFRPRFVTLFTIVDARVLASWGFDDGTSHKCTFQYSGPLMSATGSYSIYLTTGTDTCAGLISTLDADGFTIAWTKTNSPTGTATIYFKADR